MRYMSLTRTCKCASANAGISPVYVAWVKFAGVREALGGSAIGQGLQEAGLQHEDRSHCFAGKYAERKQKQAEDTVL